MPHQTPRAVLGQARCGKAEVRVLHVDRGGPRHEITDLNVTVTLPNRHHFLVDLGPFGLDNPGEVCYAADRPYGLIEGTVCRAGAPAGDPEPQW